MYIKRLRYFLLYLLILFSSLLLACATDQGAAKEKKPYAEMTKEERSRQEWEDRAIESSNYEGSTYMRQVDDEGGTDVGEYMRTRKELEAKQAETEKQLAQLEKETQSRGQGVAGAQAQGTGSEAPMAVAATATAGKQHSESKRILRFKVAVLASPGVYRSTQEMKTNLSEAAAGQFAKNQRFILVGPEESKEILSQQGLAVGRDSKSKIARSLSIYPAARLVVFIDKLTLDRKGKGRISYTLLDGFSGRTVHHREENVSTAQSGPEKDESLRLLLAKMAADLEKRAGKYGWSSRVAMVEGQQVYLSAGRASGLRKGDIFAIYGPGKEIIHPTAKVSMGFQPGPYKGKVQVSNLFGPDAAEAIAVDGAGKIKTNDLVVLPGEPK